MPRIIAVDTETYRFGRQPNGSFVVIPRMICTSWAWRDEQGIQTFLVSDGDGEAMKEQWVAWLTSSDILVFHNAAYDLSVCCETWPDLEHLVWDKLERGEITCTKNREKLLNLSTHGHLSYAPLPDGSTKQLGYGLGDLAMDYLGLDLKSQKEDDDSPRTQYDLWAGMPSKNYPQDARDYALLDAYCPMAIYEHQSNKVKSHHNRASLSTEYYQTACDFAFYLMTNYGLRVDKERFHKLRAEMQEILSEYNLGPVIRAKIVRPAEPPRPHSRQIGKAKELLETEFGEVPDWSELTEDHVAVLEAEGIKFTKPKKASLNRKVLCARIEAICEATGMPIKRTDTGGVCADAEVVSDLLAFDEPLPLEPGDEELPDGAGEEEIHPRRMTPLENYQYRQAVQKIVTTELPRMTWSEDEDDPNPPPADRVHFNFNVLVETGRTSSFGSKHYPSGNGQQIDPRGRPCYLPQEGGWLLSVDYSALELCSVAQTTYDLFGVSEHRNKINAGLDLHCNLGSGLAARLPSQFEGDLQDLANNYRMFLALKATDPKFYKHWRNFAKPVGLGYPGGLGASTFMSLAKNTYRVDIMKAAQDFPVSALPGPEHSTVAWHAKRVGITPDNWEWTPFIKGLALATLLKSIWLDTYPEMVAYFEWVTKQKDEYNRQVDDEGQSKSLLCYTTPLGMHRAGGTFTAIANGKAMQSPAAEGAKTAVFRIMKECRLGRLKGRATFPNFVHDEVILSVPADPDGAAEVIEIVEELMIDSMNNIMPDVRISVEPALMHRWYKQAAPVRSKASGLYLPWSPDGEYEVDEDGDLWLP